MKTLLPVRRVGHVHIFLGCLLPHTSSKLVQEVPALSCPGSVLPVPSTTLWSVHSFHGAHGGVKGGQTNCLTKGYKNPPVTRRLVGKSQIQPNLSPAYTNSSSYLSGVRLVGQRGEIRTGPQASLQLYGLSVQPERG